jgi:hypothetical protein
MKCKYNIRSCLTKHVKPNVIYKKTLFREIPREVAQQIIGVHQNFCNIRIESCEICEITCPWCH